MVKGSDSTGKLIHLTNISTNLTQEQVQVDIPVRMPKSVEQGNSHGSNKKETPSHSHEDSNSQKQSPLGINDQRVGKVQNDHLASTRKKAVEVVDVESSSQFSFGVEAIDTNPSNVVQQRPGKEVNLNYDIDTNQDNASNEKGTQLGKFTNPNLGYNVVIQSSSKGQYQGNGTEELVQTSQYKQGEIFDPNSYHNAFPKISNNFEKHVPKTQKSQHSNNQNQSTDETTPNSPQHTKRDQNSEPAPYTVVQTMAARLRHNQAEQETPIELVPPKITSKQGLPAIIYDMDDFMTKLAVDCKYTLVGKFSNTMPKMELIRKSFILQTQLTGGVNIAHYNTRHVFIDLENELDYNIVWTQQRMTIEGKLMRIHIWTPNFKSEEETPIVPIWILLPGLPWHCFKKEFITPLLSPISKVLYLDTTSIKRTRASMAKVKVQVDLIKARPRHVWIGLDEKDLTIGRWQTIEYESIPPYCEYCKHQGHMVYECNFKIRDEEFKKGRSRRQKRKTKTKGSNCKREAQNEEREEHTRNGRLQVQETQNRPVTGPNQTNQAV
ncbi:hypothetical protein H5410_027648 [Solanum commersonii]|uniref:DUF4283 domain-containing protein n=1 Tax=Solanum commersonii TaxID=4109 RepID=A0A9J5Z3Z1_SOLCO|nr:hypothetical protein H5410_027648 [Solanum commersonii]